MAPTAEAYVPFMIIGACSSRATVVSGCGTGVGASYGRGPLRWAGSTISNASSSPSGRNPNGSGQASMHSSQWLQSVRSRCTGTSPVVGLISVPREMQSFEQAAMHLPQPLQYSGKRKGGGLRLTVVTAAPPESRASETPDRGIALDSYLDCALVDARGLGTCGPVAGVVRPTGAGPAGRRTGRRAGGPVERGQPSNPPDLSHAYQEASWSRCDKSPGCRAPRRASGRVPEGLESLRQ